MKKFLMTACICATAFLTSCKDEVDLSKAILGDWIITEADGIAVETGFDTPAISFKEDGNVYGNTSINKFFGSYTVASDKSEAISFGNLGMTRMAGPTFETENAVTAGIGKAAKVKVISTSSVNLTDAEGNVVLRLEKKDSAAEADEK
ncbi:MAG: META domain-containing protein [Candidatus Cryptobacteroides sp.]